MLYYLDSKKMKDKRDIIDQVTDLHQEITSHLSQSLRKVIQIGELLDRQEANFKHGEFGAWVSTKLPFSVSRAREYMKVYREREALKEEKVPEFSLKKTYELLVQHREEDPILKIKQAFSLMSEVKAELEIIKDQVVLTNIHQLSFEMSKIFFEMGVLAERQLWRIEKLIQEGFFEIS